MKRKFIIGGNWKMNKGIPVDAINSLKGLKSLLKEDLDVDIFIAPPFTSLTSAIEITKGTNLSIGAQNGHFEDTGAFTGEISLNFLRNIGCNYVILGHSERRHIFNESDDFINQKVRKALSIGLIPIFCVGETLKERESGKTKDIIEFQFENSLKDISEEDITKAVIAYEPVWAIGTGKTATPEQAEEIHFFIRNIIKDKYSSKAADSIRIQYGGSIKPGNSYELFKQENIDGGLVGGASLNEESFYNIIKSAVEVSQIH